MDNWSNSRHLNINVSGGIINEFDETDQEDLKKLGFNGTSEDFNHYYIEHSFSDIAYYIFSTSTLEKIDEFLKQIIKSEKEKKQGANFNKLIFEEINGKWYLKYKGKEKWVRENEMTKSISLNICLLMFGYPVTYIKDPSKKRPDIFSDYLNYQEGSKIHVDVLRELILIRGEKDYDPPPKNDKFRPIRDAIGGINKLAKNELGLEKIFEYKDQEVWIVA